MLWSRAGSQGEKWKKASVQIPVSPAPYNLVIEGSMGAPDQRGIALDDIVLVDHACPVDEATSLTLKMTSAPSNPLLGRSGRDNKLKVLVLREITLQARKTATWPS